MMLPRGKIIPTDVDINGDHDVNRKSLKQYVANDIAANTRRWTNDSLMLGQH